MNKQRLASKNIESMKQLLGNYELSSKMYRSK